MTRTFSRRSAATCAAFLLLSVLPATSKTSQPAPGITARPQIAAANDLETFYLTDYGAVGDGEADDGPALQRALDALAEAGGGTLFVPAGRYAIDTRVEKDFAHLASTLTILGVESNTPLAPPTASGGELSQGLNLASEFIPKTGADTIAVSIAGLQNFLIRDIAFVGTPPPEGGRDALVTLLLTDIQSATIEHCEFYGLYTDVEGGAIVKAVRCDLTIDQTKFLGCAATNGTSVPLVQILEWTGIRITGNTAFVDYGARPTFFGKTAFAPAMSSINIGNARTTNSESPRREVLIRDVFIDEGTIRGITCFPHAYQPPTADIDLLYISGLVTNTSNLDNYGIWAFHTKAVLIKNSSFKWAVNSLASIALENAGNVIINQTLHSVNNRKIVADAQTERLVVINSTNYILESAAQFTDDLTTDPEDDPVQYVRTQFQNHLGHDPDPAAHFYWSDLLIKCGDDAQCLDDTREALAAYLAAAPSRTFSITGRVLNEDGDVMAGVNVTLNGSQSVKTTTDSEGHYRFSNLPTSGNYFVTASAKYYAFQPLSFITPTGNVTADIRGEIIRPTIRGHVVDENNHGIAGVEVMLSGEKSGSELTDSHGAFTFFSLNAGGNYIVTPSKRHYTFSPTFITLSDLDSDRQISFQGILKTHTLSGTVTDGDGKPVGGVTVTLSGDQSDSVLTNTDGSFVFILEAGGNYTITPSKRHYTFSPDKISISDPESDQKLSFKGILKTLTLEGTVSGEDGKPLEGVTVKLSGDQSASEITGSEGTFSFSVNAGGNYTITPSKKHHTFSPDKITISDLESDQKLSFKGILKTLTLEGTVSREDGKPLKGVTVKLSGDQSASEITGSKGTFSFSVKAGGNYAVTPSAKHYTFNPEQVSFNDLDADQTINFAASRLTFTISGLVTDGSEPLGGATVTLDGDRQETYTTDEDGAFIFLVNAGESYVVTASHELYEFAEKLILAEVEQDYAVELTGQIVPIILSEADSDSAVALESTTFIRDPFSLSWNNALTSETGLRISLFVVNLLLESDEQILMLSESNPDAESPLVVEFVGPVIGMEGLTQIVIKLPENLAPGKFWIRLKKGELSSNKVFVRIVD